VARFPVWHDDPRFTRLYITGSGLPFALAKAGVDPANAGTSVQVIMDVLGVGITCVSCDFVLNRLSMSLGYS